MKLFTLLLNFYEVIQSKKSYDNNHIANKYHAKVALIYKIRCFVQHYGKYIQSTGKSKV